MRYEPKGVEKLIQDAQKEGKFDDLACRGQRLPVAFGDLATVANDVMRDNAIVPEWIALGRAIEGLRGRQEALIAGLVRRRGDDRAALDASLGVWSPARRSAERGWRCHLRHFLRGDREARARRALQPPSIAERMEVDRRRTLRQVAELVRMERRTVDRFNMVLPIGGRQMHRVRVEVRLAAFQGRFPALALAVCDGAWRVYEREEPVPPELLAETEEPGGVRGARSSEQAEALNSLRNSRRRPRPLG